MESRFNDTFERSLEQLAQRFEYPPTPDIAATIGPRTVDNRTPLAAKTTRDDGRPSSVVRRPSGGRLAWLVLLITLVLAGLFAIPQTRAAVLSLFARIGAIDIFIDETAPTVTPLPTPTPLAAASPATISATKPATSVAHSLGLFQVGEPVSLDEARRLTSFALVVPDSLGEPDGVYVHRNIDLPAVTLVWRDEGDTPLSLTEIGTEAFAMKMVAEERVKWIQIGDLDAVWLEGPHRLQLFGEVGENSSLLIESNVLIWSADGVTYRLEGELSQEEMTAIAESL